MQQVDDPKHSSKGKNESALMVQLKSRAQTTELKCSGGASGELCMNQCPQTSMNRSDVGQNSCKMM